MGKKGEKKRAVSQQIDGTTAKELEELLSVRVEILNDFGEKLVACKRHKKALAVLEEALELSQVLVKISSDLYLPALAATLGNVGICYCHLGRHEEALAMTAKAVKHFKALADGSPENFLPVLAANLNNLGACYGACGRDDEALVVVEESVRIYRSLAGKEPETYLFDLERSLRNLGYCYGVLHREEKAMVALTEAGVRSVCFSCPDKRPQLPRALATLADLWRQKGNHSTADQLEKEAARMSVNDLPPRNGNKK